MKVHQEVYIKIRSLNGEDLIEILIKFTLETIGWSFINDQSKEYTQWTGFPSCIIQLDDGHICPSFAITYRSKGVYCIANIVPLGNEQILIPEYNSFSVKFVQDFRAFIRKNKFQISITITTDNIGLDKIIPSLKARMLFEKYLNARPISYHPNDIERLDIFICAVSRFCRKRINLYHLKGYLLEDLNWTAKDAEWCFDRIETGLDILDVKKKFY